MNNDFSTKALKYYIRMIQDSTITNTNLTENHKFKILFNQTDQKSDFDQNYITNSISISKLKKLSFG